MRFVIGIMLMAVWATTGTAASHKGKCATLAGPTNQASRGFSGMFVSMQGLDYRVIAKEFSGAERDQFLKMARLQDDLMPVFEEYLFELETLALMMARCSR